MRNINLLLKLLVVLCLPLPGLCQPAHAAGEVWAWGRNDEGQLGDGSTTNRSTPVHAIGLSGVTATAPGPYHTVALKNDGTVWAWGELGGTTPVPVSGLSGVTAIASGQYHSMALKNDGTVWAWGANLYGQLGDGTTTQRATPVQVSGLSGVTAIACGGSVSLAITETTAQSPAITLTEPVEYATIGNSTTLRADTQGAIQSVAFSQRTAVSLSRTPNLRFSDARTTTDAGSIATAGVIDGASLALNIQHLSIGDLVVVLIAPDGTRRVVHNRYFGSTDNINATYNLALVGKQMAGTWQLEVSDNAPENSGSLVSWSLNLIGAWVSIGNGVQNPANVWTVPWRTSGLTPGAYQVRAVATYGTGSVADSNFVTVVPTYSISGRITNSANVGIGGVSVTRTGGVMVPTNANGDFTFIDLTAGTYTITPARTGYTFAPVDRSVTITNASVTAQNFTGTPAPTVTNFTPKSGPVGALVTITGTNFTGATVVQFNGTSASFTVNSATQITATVPAGATTGKISVTTPGGTRTGPGSFTVTMPTFTISGRITNSAGVGVANVRVQRTGSATAVYTNATGNFTFTNVPAGTYTLTPEKNNVGFTPDTRSVTVSTANIADENFIASFSISGRITNKDGTGIANVPVKCITDNSTTTASTDASGNYSFSGVPSGTCTLTPEMTGVTFMPASRVVTVATVNIANQNFFAAFSISGRVTNSDGVGVANVPVKRIGNNSVAAAYTDASGYYTLLRVPSGSYTLLPEANGVSFTPATSPVTITTASVANQNFIATFSISGRITNSAGVGLANVPVQCTTDNTTATTFTDANGNYRFSGVSSGSYTLTPEATGVKFTPVSRAVTVVTANVANLNFIGS